MPVSRARCSPAERSRQQAEDPGRDRNEERVPGPLLHSNRLLTAVPSDLTAAAQPRRKTWGRAWRQCNKRLWCGAGLFIGSFCHCRHAAMNRYCYRPQPLPPLLPAAGGRAGAGLPYRQPAAERHRYALKT